MFCLLPLYIVYYLYDKKKLPQVGLLYHNCPRYRVKPLSKCLHPKFWEHIKMTNIFFKRLERYEHFHIEIPISEWHATSFTQVSNIHLQNIHSV